MKTEKIIVKKTIALMFTVMFLVSMILVVYAANNIDTAYNYSFSNNSAITVARAKTDSSSCYMNYNSGSISYTAQALGMPQEEGPVADDVSAGYHYSFTLAHERRFMYNYAYEWGYPYLCIGASCSTNGVASGLWSPDSVYEYGVLPESDFIQ